MQKPCAAPFVPQAGCWRSPATAMNRAMTRIWGAGIAFMLELAFPLKWENVHRYIYFATITKHPVCAERDPSSCPACPGFWSPGEEARGAEHFVTTDCPSGRSLALCCKTQSELRVYVELATREREVLRAQGGAAAAAAEQSWWCHVDDDNYVNLPALASRLKALDASRPVYVGRGGPVQWGNRLHVPFAMGGAGNCLGSGVRARETVLNSESANETKQKSIPNHQRRGAGFPFLSTRTAEHDMCAPAPRAPPVLMGERCISAVGKPCLPRILPRLLRELRRGAEGPSALSALIRSISALDSGRLTKCNRSCAIHPKPQRLLNQLVA